MANTVRNIAPFINDVFSISSKWWYERVDPITGEVKIHRGLDITTGVSKPVYSKHERRRNGKQHKTHQGTV